MDAIKKKKKNGIIGSRFQIIYMRKIPAEMLLGFDKRDRRWLLTDGNDAAKDAIMTMSN